MINGNVTNTKSLTEHAIERMVQAELALQALAQEHEAARAEIERLRTRVGWLDHLDTEDGRRMHANEALLVEIERLKARVVKDELKEARAEIEKHSNNVWLADLAKQVQADLIAARAEIKRLKAELAKLKACTP